MILDRNKQKLMRVSRWMTWVSSSYTSWRSSKNKRGWLLQNNKR